MKQPEKPKGFLLRLPADLMKRLQHAQIDSQYNSLNAWIVAAITEKLERGPVKGYHALRLDPDGKLHDDWGGSWREPGFTRNKRTKPRQKGT